MAAAAEVAPRTGKREGKREEMGFRVLVYMAAGGAWAGGRVCC